MKWVPMAKDKLYQAMKIVAKENGVKASAQNDLYKMVSPYFVSAFYSEHPSQDTPGKIKVRLSYRVKYSYFDDLTLFIVDPESTVKLTDKVRANSVIACKSVISNEDVDFECDGRDESYEILAKNVFQHIEKWFQNFFDDVKKNYCSLEDFFIKNKNLFPRQAALVYIHSENYTDAEECLKYMPPKMNSVRTVRPMTVEQVQRLIDSAAKKWGEDSFLRDDMDCHFDFIIAKKKSLEWNGERSRYGLLEKERL